MASEYARWLSYPIMVVVGVPLYICASASTPIAAALVAKGFSPGAALIFLMTGPATNTGTIAIIMSQFGVRFASVYVSSVIAVTVVLGILVDILLLATGLGITVNLAPSESTTIQLLQWGSAFALFALVVWRFRAGALKSGYEDLLMNIRPVSSRWRSTWARMTRNRSFRGVLTPNTPMGLIVWVLAIGMFLATGFTTIPPDSVGYGRLAGRVVWKDLQPGLHYLAPRPLVRVDKWPVRQVRSIMGDTPHEYVAGDLNLLSVTVNAQYRVKDPYTYHYRTNNPQEIIERFVRDHVRAFIGARDLEQLLTAHRATLEHEIGALLLDPGEDGSPALESIDLVKVNLLNIVPTVEALSAFRDVSSAQEDMERIVVNAQRFMAQLVPQAHGNAEYEVRQAEGAAYGRVETSRAEAEAIITVASAVGTAPEVLENMLWREKLETALSGNTKIIVPSQDSLEKVALWKKRPDEVPAANGQPGQEHRAMNMKKKLISVVAAIALGVVAYDSFYVINETEQGVLTHFGRISPPVRQPGFHLKWPWPVSAIYKVDRRIHTLTNLPNELLTEDQKSILVDGYVLWRVVDPILFVEAIRTGESAIEKLQDLYLSSSGIIISNMAREAFIGLGLEHEDTDVAAAEILARIAPVALESYGIEVIRAGIVEYTLPPENRPSVIERMIAERARIATRYRSEGEEMAIRIEALAINEHERLLAEAHAEATTILGRAEAEAISLLGRAYQQDPEFYKFIRALDSYDLIIDRNTTLMLPADNELFKYLDSREAPNP